MFVSLPVTVMASWFPYFLLYVSLCLDFPDSGSICSDFLFKFLVIGSAGTGKSCLLHQFIENKCECLGVVPGTLNDGYGHGVNKWAMVGWTGAELPIDTLQCWLPGSCYGVCSLLVPP